MRARNTANVLTGGNMAAVDEVELFGDKTDDTRTISIRNKTKDKTIRASVHIGGACPERFHVATLKPREEATVAQEGPGDEMCIYKLDSADYMTS
jgi:hypothetical protein